MKRIVEYFVSYVSSFDIGRSYILELENKPIVFKNLEALKDYSTIALLFWRRESEYDEENVREETFLERKYFIGKEYLYNDLPKRVNDMEIDFLDEKLLISQNPKCVVVRSDSNVVLLLENCGDYKTDDCEKVIIDPDDLDKIKEITKDGIVYESQNENNGTENQENEEGIEQ